jgi:Ala-tRNA(Pro) deacylase
MPHATPADLLARLDELGLKVETHHHEAVFTVAESAGVKASLPGAHSKNLFVKDKKGRLFLITAQDTTQVDLKHLGPVLGATGRLSFGSPQLLGEVLGVTPGSVTAFAAINDTEGRVQVVLDARLMANPLLNAHPLINTMTTAISRDDLVTFLRATGHEPRILALSAEAGENCMALAGAPS